MKDLNSLIKYRNAYRIGNDVIRTISHVIILLILSTRMVQAECWQQAGISFRIPPTLLYAIAEQESSLNTQAIGKNKNGSRDIGLMQINSRHLTRLEKFGINEQQLLNNGCLSVFVGASILAGFIDRYGYSWEAVGAYNAGTTSDNKNLRMRYAKKVWERYRRLQISTE